MSNGLVSELVLLIGVGRAFSSMTGSTARRNGLRIIGILKACQFSVSDDEVECCVVAIEKRERRGAPIAVASWECDSRIMVLLLRIDGATV